MDPIEQKLWESYRESYKEERFLYPEIEEYMRTFELDNDPEFVSVCSGYLLGYWRTMIDVCYNPDNELYPMYGGRGLRVHKPWMEDFIGLFQFIYDVKYPESITDKLVHIDEMDDFYPHNLKWVKRELEIYDDDD